MGRWRTQVYSRAPRDENDRDPPSTLPHEEVNGKKAAAGKGNMAHLDPQKDPNQNGQSVKTRWWNGNGNTNNEPEANGDNGDNGDETNVQQMLNAKSNTENNKEGLNGMNSDVCIGGVVCTIPLSPNEEGDVITTGNGNGRSANGYSDGETDVDNDEDLRCGLGPCTPSYLQMFASKQVFLATFCITWVLQGMYYTYFVSVITTIEKLFQFQSKTTGIIMSATEIGQIGSSLLLTYYGGQGHRPKWIAWGMVLFAVSSFTCSMPHFIFGGPYGKHSYNVTVNPNHCRKSDSESFQLDSALSTSIPPLLPGASPISSLLTASLYSDDGGSFFFSPPVMDPPMSASLVQPKTGRMRGRVQSSCEKEEDKIEERIHSKITTIVLAIFFISLLGVGMGQTAVCTLGIPYIDDNVTSRESPLYFAITIGVRILGPALGFILGSLCTRLYADLTIDPQITPNDPRWIGAWWLGLVLVSSMLMLASLAMFSFPKRLKTARPTTRAIRQEKKNPSLRDFPKAVKRLLGNDILMCRTASSVLHILPIAGIYTFLPKYLESQFRLPAHDAAMISGVGGILVMGLGIIISGVFILRVKPNARFVAAWIAFTAALYAIGMGILMFIGCPMDDFAGLVTKDQGIPRFEPICQTTCECDLNKFSPICGTDGMTYFSACHAGCTNFTIVNDKITQFSDCQCIYSNVTSANSEQLSLATATIGYCDLQCSNFIWYILLFSLFVFIHSTSEVGSMLLILRCVDPRDKAMALGLIQFAIGLFGNVPCPIVYGAIVDSACLVWDMACGKQGACWLYDADIFRMFYHGMTGAIMLCAFFVDCIVWYKADNVSFADDPAPAHEEELNPIAAKPHPETSV